MRQSLQQPGKILPATGSSALADLLGVADESVSELAAAANQMYRVYPIVKGPKKRWIEAPHSELKQRQRQLLDSMLYRLAPHDAAHGFVPGRSIVSTARLHTGQDWVVTMDICDFFPSISSQAVDRSLASLNMSEFDRRLLGLLLTRNGRLPQGAPTSPHLANLVARSLDRRLTQLAAGAGWKYSRYADDLAFSGTGHPAKLIRNVERILIDEGFQPARRKTRVMSRHQRQTVTGLVVNQKVALPRNQRRKLRAMLHRLDGITGSPSALPDINVVHGHLAWAAFIDPAGYQLARRQVSDLVNAETTK